MYKIDRIIESVKQMLRIQAASNITLKEMNQRLIKIEGAVKRHAQDPSGIDDHIIAPFLPLATIENVKEFDSLLKKSEESVQQFVSFKLFVLCYTSYLVIFLCCDLLYLYRVNTNNFSGLRQMGAFSEKSAQ